MLDIAVLITDVKLQLADLSKQTAALGQGLQNAAPGNRGAGSVQYLLEVTEQLQQSVIALDQLNTLLHHKE